MCFAVTVKSETNRHFAVHILIIKGGKLRTCFLIQLASEGHIISGLYGHVCHHTIMHKQVKC